MFNTIFFVNFVYTTHQSVTMKQFLSIIFILSIFAVSSKAQVVFEGSAEAVINITPAPSTGLETVYVIKDTNGMTMSYSGSSDIKWSRFSTNGAAYAESIGSSNTIVLDKNDCGYVAEVDGKSHYFWVVNYRNHEFSVSEFIIDTDNSDCQRTAFHFAGKASPISFYTINGRPETLDRNITLSYSTLEFDAEANVYHQTVQSVSYPSINSVVSVESPLCDTRFTLNGDRFLKEWRREISVETPTIKATAISAETTAEQDEREIDNEQKVQGTSLGGSTPCEINFSAIVSDAASFYEWQLSRNPDFDPIDDRYPQTDFSYTFREQGNTYVRFFAANDDGHCEYYSSVYEVSIGESDLRCPNAFSPKSTPGVNDEWKVSYKSIVSFDCHIFNRWGIEMCSFSDPSLGWDGKYNGKYVPAGTYYYVIKARGADGREYKLSGDINIINSKDNFHSSESTE